MHRRHHGSSSSCSPEIQLWHGTTEDRLLKIRREGFRCSEDGAYGPAIYLTSSQSKAAAWAALRSFNRRSPGVVIKCIARLQACKDYDISQCQHARVVDYTRAHPDWHDPLWSRYVDQHGTEVAPPPGTDDDDINCACRCWLSEPFDSQYVPPPPRDDPMLELCNGDEYAIKDSRLVDYVFGSEIDATPWNFVRHDVTWDVVVQAACGWTSFVQFLKRCICPDDSDLALRELYDQIAGFHPEVGATLQEAICHVASLLLEQTLPQTPDRKYRASLMVQNNKNDLPRMWADVRSEFHGCNPPHYLRHLHRLLLIKPGFGIEATPEQIAFLRRGGWCEINECDAPFPESSGFDMGNSIQIIVEAIELCRPHAVIAASKGGAYLLELWRRGYQIPSVMINLHPRCQQLPPDSVAIICHGSRDTTFARDQRSIEELMQVSNPRCHFFYYSGDSGPLPSGRYLRIGDQHEMASLLQHDLLNRLIDAAIAGGSKLKADLPDKSEDHLLEQNTEFPDQYIMQTWCGFISQQRRASEEFLGYSMCQLSRFWQARARNTNHCLFTVDLDSLEGRAVQEIFLAESPEPRHYKRKNEPDQWGESRVLRVQRVQNSFHRESAQVRRDAVRTSLTQQGVVFKAGVHVRWLFHGPGNTTAVDSIANTLDGFNPLVSGSAVGQMWGAGVYFARDAQYTAWPPYVVQLDSGERQIFLCLIETGISCLASPEHVGMGCLLPFRCGHHRYNSTVDSLSNPEIFIVQYGCQAVPAYLITFC